MNVLNLLMLREAAAAVASSHPEGHGCDACLATRGDPTAYARLTRAYEDRLPDPLPGAPDVTAGDLEAHARKYGADGVGEVADAHGLDVDITGAPTPRRGRRR